MNLIITGLMGSGKTTIGRRVAKALGRDFVDTDEYLNERIGPAREILSRPDGDAAFREAEENVADELSGKTDLVISTGGRFLLSQKNIDRLSPGGYIVCFTADIDELVERLLSAGPGTYRPRFSNAKDKHELMRSLERRSEPFFSQFVQIRTSGIDPDGIARSIISRFSAVESSQAD